MLNIKEYKGLTAKFVSEKTGLPNPYADQTKYSLARQLELMLRDAHKNGVLHLVPKTVEVKHVKVKSAQDKGVTILTQSEEARIEYTSELDLNTIPHKVIREKGYITIVVERKNIPMNVIPHPSKPYSYLVIGILTEMKCYNAGSIYVDTQPSSGPKKVGKKYSFGYGKHISLEILD